MQVSRGFILGALAIGTTIAAFAQGTGGLQVRVLDRDGLPLPSALVTLSHATGYVKTHTVQADKRGEALFPVLRPGEGYTIEVAMPGFGTRRDPGIRVPLGEVAVVAIQLAEETTFREVVIGDDDVIDLEDTSGSRKFDEAFIEGLPVPGRTYSSVLTRAPGVNDANGDGNPTVHGSRSRDFRAEVGGVANVDPVTGQQMSQVNMDSIEAIEVIATGAGVEFGRAQGAHARILIKQGTNQFEGTFGLLYRSSELDGTGAHDLTNLQDPEFDTIHPSFQVSGPIVKDKLWYRLSHEVRDQENPVNTVGQIVTQENRQGIHSDQLTWQVSPRNKLAFRLQSDPLTITNFGVASTTPADATQQIDTESQTFSVTWTAPYSPRLLVETTAAWQDLESVLAPSASGVLNNCVSGDAFLAAAQCTNFQTQEVSGSHFLTNTSHSQRLSLLSQATLFAGEFWGANHQFKFGMAIENERFFRDLERRPNIGYFVLNPVQDPDDDAGQTPQEIHVITATLGVPGESRVRATGTNWAFYVEDQIKPWQNLVITAGLRVDREEIDAKGLHPFDPAAEQSAFFEALGGTAPLDAVFRDAFTRYEGIADFVTELSNATGLAESQIQGQLANVTRQSGFWDRTRSRENMDIGNTNLSPALAVSWDPWATGKNKFAASARRFYDKIILAVPLVENNPATTTLVFNAEPDPDTGLLAVTGLRNNINPAVNVEAVDRNLDTPYQDEWRLAYEREVWRETLLRVEYVNRKFRSQLQNIDVNHRAGDFGRCRLADSVNTRGLAASPGSGFQIVDPYTGEVYQDTDPGDGDGRLDDCVGEIEVPASNRDARIEGADGVADLYVQNPGFGQILVIGNFNRADYEGFVLELIRRQYRSWELQGSYTWSMAEGNGEDFRQFIGLDQSLLEDEFGYQSNDQRHVVKVSATTITPWGFRLGSNVTWASGLPYSVLGQDLSFDAVPPAYRSLGSFNPARPRLQYPTGVRNSERNDSQWLVDLKLTKEISPGRINAQLSAEVFNVLNDGTYQIFNPNFETGFQINGVNNARFEFGRRWQLGLKLAF